jgi:hypothetical protein
VFSNFFYSQRKQKSLHRPSINNPGEFCSIGSGVFEKIARSTRGQRSTFVYLGGARAIIPENVNVSNI